MRAASSLALVLVAGTAGCAVPPPNDPATTLQVGVLGDFAGLDPALQTNAMSDAFAAQVLETLVRLQPGSFSVVPGLAQRWQVAPDGLTWTFNLRPGAVFSDGTPVDAAAVVANFDRWRVAADQRHYGHDYPQYVHYFGGYDAQSVIDSVMAQSALEVIVHTRSPFAALPRVLALPAFSIGSPAAMSKDRQVYEDVPTGSGPFVARDLSDGEYVALTRNAAYTGPRTDERDVTLRAVPDPGTALLALDERDLDAVLDVPFLALAARSSGTALTLAPRPSDATCELVFISDRAPFDEPGVRRAVAEAVDRTRIAAAFGPPAIGPAARWLPPEMPGSGAGSPELRYDPSNAKRLLSSAKSASTPIVLYYPLTGSALLPQPQLVAQDVAADLGAAGFSVTLSGSVGPPFDLARGALVLEVATSRSGDPDELASSLLTTWHDAGFAALVAQERVTSGEAERAQVLHRLDAYVVQNAGAVPLVHPVRMAALRPALMPPLDAAALPRTLASAPPR